MQKSLSEMAAFIKGLIPKAIPETYSLLPEFERISNERDVKNGILAFRDFMLVFYDRLFADGHLYDRPQRIDKPENASHTSTAGNHPLLTHTKSILINIGYHGQFDENGYSLVFTDMQSLITVISVDGSIKRAKISVPKIIESLRFLESCGVCFTGIDLNGKKPDISNISTLIITYPDDPAMLTGLKVMAVAQRDLHLVGNDDIFLRCDYRALKKEDSDAVDIIKDFTNPLGDDVRDLIVKLHSKYLEKGLSCTTSVKYMRIRSSYFHKSHVIWDITATVNYGYRLYIKAKNTDLYADLIKGFPPDLQDKIARGYGCEKKRFGTQCQHGCHGFSFILDKSVLNISLYLEEWLDKELLCLQKK